MGWDGITRSETGSNGMRPYDTRRDERNRTRKRRNRTRRDGRETTKRTAQNTTKTGQEGQARRSETGLNPVDHDQRNKTQQNRSEHLRTDEESYQNAFLLVT